MRVRLFTPTKWLWAWLVLDAACSAYEPGKLKSYEAPSVGSGGTMAPPPPRTPDAGPRVPTGGADPGDVMTSRPQCGDGEVSLDEKCDVSIPEGEPGACPRECPPLADCVMRMLNGSNCDAECVELATLCMAGDDCCPSMCDHASDSDCSGACGDGVVQEDLGETCEPDVDGGVACPTQAGCEDGDPCTDDKLVGSERNCNATCSRTQITALVSGDHCCPEGANANTDSDCSVDCGNGVREGDEECDGSLGCENCRLTLTPTQISCLEKVDARDGNSCDECACRQCAMQDLDCRASGNATRDMHCAEVADCGNDHDCARASCYCDNPSDPFCIAPGPCRTQIDAAAMSDPSAAPVTTQQNDPNTAIGKAVLLSDCKAANCADVCP
jgi:hypothetical protein